MFHPGHCCPHMERQNRNLLNEQTFSPLLPQAELSTYYGTIVYCLLESSLVVGMANATLPGVHIQSRFSQ